jgi:curved DNA-binding protein CbpA
MNPRPRIDKDYYRTLGVAAAATEDEIRRAYRRLALQYHPDRNPGNPRAEEQFKEVSEAYGVLIDSAKRRDYDRVRQGGRTAEFRHTREDVFRDLFADPRASAVFEELRREFERLGMHVDRHDFHQTLFGGRAVVTGGVFVITPFTPVRLLFRLVGAALGAARADRAQIERGRTDDPSRSPAHPTSVSTRPTAAVTDARPSAPPGRRWLERALRAGQWLLGTPRDTSEPAGRPRRDTGDVSGRDIVMPIMLSRADVETGGRKSIVVEHDGRREEILVTIPRGTRAGTRLRLRGKGRAGSGGVPGDLYLTVEVAG